MPFQPILVGPILLLRPMLTEDSEALYQAASDPLIWQQHPQPLRYQREVFQVYLDSTLASGGALVVVDQRTQQIIGGSRYYDLEDRAVAIGFTFLARAYWGGSTNRELKTLMLNHAFQHVEAVWFHVEPNNLRSRKAMEKIGATLSHIGEKAFATNKIVHCFYRIHRQDWASTTPA
jgi:RimJ/RimL family protein N-acetyltransferase